jgi:hypothetical protein
MANFLFDPSFMLPITENNVTTFLSTSIYIELLVRPPTPDLVAFTGALIWIFLFILGKS